MRSPPRDHDTRDRGKGALSEGRLAPRAARIAGLMGGWFGWLPAQFWMTTPAEILSLVGAMHDAAAPATDPLSSTELRSLQEQYPDE